MPKKEEKSTLSLGRQMMSMSIFVSLAPLFIITLVLHSYYNYAYTEKTVAYLESLAVRHAENINTYLHEKLGNIEQLALCSPLPNLVNDEILQRKLSRLQSVYAESFNDLGVLTSKGEQIAYAGPFPLQKVDYANAPWFQTAIKQNTTISDVFLGMRRISHFIVTKKFIRDDDTWLLRATIDFAGFNSIVRDIHIGKTGNAFIINRNGEFQTDRREGIHLEKEVLELLARQKLTKGQATFLEGKGPDNKDYFYVSAPLKNNEWILVLQQDRADALAELGKVRTLAAIILVVSSALVVFTVVFLTRRMQHRLVQAEDSTETMQKQMVEAGKLVAIGELAAGIAHEINNPVAIMMENAGWVQDLLQMDKTKQLQNLEEIESSLQEIGIQGSRCKDITHKLLSFARKTDSRIRKVDVNDLLTELISFSSQKARYGNVTVKTEFAEDLPVLMVSPTELQQVILNLVNNAIDAMDKDENVLIVRSRKEQDEVIIDVADNGEGIAPANLTRIFEPFFTTKPVGKGTGLGLAICYGIIHKMGGKITVESELGEGTVFSIRIPVIKDTQ